MESSLARVPEPAVMAPDEEAEYIRANSFIFKDTHPLVLDFARLCPGFSGKPVRILDIGCGVANMSVEFAKTYPEAEVVAVDASAGMLRHARMLVGHFGMGDRVSVCCAWLPDADFGEPDRSFDLVFARSALHHFVAPAEFWRTVARYAKRDAAVFVTDLLRPPGWAELEEQVWQRFNDTRNAIRSAFHASLLASHTAGEIRRQLDEAGLGDMTVAPWMAVPFARHTHVTIWRAGRFGKETR